jgi:hypothetical protein
MSFVTILGVCAVTLMMVFYALEDRARWLTLGFAIACLGASGYGWLAGTWPFGIVEALWAIVAFRKWLTRISVKQSRQMEAGSR